MGSGGGAGAGASVAPPNAAGAFNGTNPNYGAPTQQGQGALNYLGNMAAQMRGQGGGGGAGAGGAGAGGMNASGGYMGGHL
jgi:hypothetical protein